MECGVAVVAQAAWAVMALEEMAMVVFQVRVTAAVAAATGLVHWVVTRPQSQCLRRLQRA